MATLASIKRGILYRLADDAEANSMPLGDAIKAFHKSRFSDDQVQSGRTVISVSGAGKSVTFASPATGTGLDQTGITELAQELREVYDAALVYLTAAGTTYDREDPASNSTILAQMLDDDRLHAVTCYTTLHGGWQ